MPRESFRIDSRLRHGCFNPPSASMPRESLVCEKRDCQNSFNPPSASMPRERNAGSDYRIGRYVSIRPRHRCRGKGSLIPASGGVVGFNPPSASMPRERRIGRAVRQRVICFNPPSASMPRESDEVGAYDGTSVVSIRPRHRCRGKDIGVGGSALQGLFQSALGIDAEGKPIRSNCTPWIICFNPPSASMPRESKTHRMDQAPVWFQSALGIDAEGKVVDHGARRRRSVSIRPRHRCRGKGRSPSPNWRSESFQSALGIDAEGKGHARDIMPDVLVSIRPRHRCRGKGTRSGAPGRAGKFQSALGIDAEGKVFVLASAAIAQFQSALGIDAEGKAGGRGGCRWRVGFNPPSASMPRESRKPLGQ